MLPMPVDSVNNYYSKLDAIKGWGLKQLAGGIVPASAFYKQLELPSISVVDDDKPFSLEIVSHCWQYAHLLRYQLSSIVLHAPSDINVTVTVYYCESDLATVATLSYFESINRSNVNWNWQSFPKEYLYRRSIGRNHAALNTKADWIWFTDCDVIFYKNCFSSLAQQLRQLQTPLVFPLIEYRSYPLPSEHQALHYDGSDPAIIDIDPKDYVATEITRATGPLQIVHADVARKLGYCKQSVIYQKPAQQWCKALEDRLFRWLLGTQGVGRPIEGVFRIQHQEKGRYIQGSRWSWLRERAQAFKTKTWQATTKSKKTAQSAMSPND